jgi:trypsin
MSARRTIIVAGLASAATLALGGCGRDSDPSALDVLNGREAGGLFPAVVALVDADGEVVCTGTFVSATTVLTAAHCLVDFDRAGDLRLKGKNTPAKALYYNDAYDPDDVTTWSFDQGVVVFPAGTAPATLGFAARAPAKGDTVTIAGYGQTDLEKGSGNGLGTLRYGTNVIDDLFDGLITYWAPIEATTSDGENAGSSYGDSGGPLLVGGKLAGTCVGETSRKTSSFRDTYANVYSSAYRDFLRDAVREAGADVPELPTLLDSTPSSENGTSVRTSDAPVSPRSTAVPAGGSGTPSLLTGLLWLLRWIFRF